MMRIQTAGKALALWCVLGWTSGLQATGLATCDSGPAEGWKSKAELQHVLEERGWQVRRIKEDGGCYEVYAIDENGKKVEAYFHPVSLEAVPIDREEE